MGGGWVGQGWGFGWGGGGAARGGGVFWRGPGRVKFGKKQINLETTLRFSCGQFAPLASEEELNGPLSPSGEMFLF